MATFTVTTSVNIDTLTAKTGGDIYNINGGTLTIDQDSRVGLNQSTSASLGAITLSASLGGTLQIDGSAIWMIPFTGGSGTVPAWNTTITNGTGTGLLIAVHSALNVASTATGAAMPATGFIRVKQKSGAYVAGALTGITATASDAGRIGWLEIVGDDASTINANRLGTCNIQGAWYAVGTTSGVSNQTIQIPSNGLLKHIPGVYIEKTAGLADYEFYPNAGTTTTTGTEADRGKVVWIDNTGLLRIGNSGIATNGYTPASGLAIVIGNVFLECCTTAARTANVIPNATLATRYDFTCSGGGVVTIDKATSCWYGSFAQAYSVAISNSCFSDAVLFSEIATAMTVSKLGVGNKPTTALLTPALTMTYCYAGGTFTDCNFARVSMATTGQYTATLNDCSGFTFTDCTFRANTIQANATVYSIFATRIKSCTFTRPVIIQGAMNFVTCDTIVTTDVIYTNCVSGTTVTTYATYVWNLSTNTINSTFSGLTFPVTNTQPYTALLTATTGCANIKLRNIGTRAVPLNGGTVNACGLIYTLPTSAACSDLKFQRIYMSNTRTGIMTADNSSKDVFEENVWGDYADAADVMAVLNHTRRGMGGTGALTAQTSIYGTHWRDGFTSTTAGRLAVLMNEASADTTAQVTLSNGAAFTSAGGLYMPVIGHSVIFETPTYILGHTAFANTALVMAVGTSTNYSFEYSIDVNNGSGYSTMTSASYTATTLATALSAVTIDASLGFKLKLKMTTITTNTSAITSIYLTTVSTTTAQDYQYPLETVVAKVTVKDAITFLPIQDARVYLIASGGGPQSDGTVLLTGASDASGIVQNTLFAYLGDQQFTGRGRKATSGTRYKPAATSGTITSSGLDLTIFLISDE